MSKETEVNANADLNADVTGACVFYEGDAERCDNSYTKAQCDALKGTFYPNDNCGNHNHD